MTSVARVPALIAGTVAVVLAVMTPMAGADDSPVVDRLAADRPTVAVALGDSAASGEGAGDYQPGTDWPGNYCHRSRNAYIHQLDVPSIDMTVNLACFAASSTHLRIGGQQQFGEASQTERLARVARMYDVRLITVQIGANDDPHFDETILECVMRFAILIGPGCKDTVGEEWTDRLRAMRPKVTDVIADIKVVMDRAGYRRDDYDLVLLSYASPVTEHMQSITHAAACPIRKSDAEWGRTVATVELADALRRVAQISGTRFLDLSRSMEGREACHRDAPDGAGWVRTMTLRGSTVVDGVGPHLVQESFHPNARGHAQIGRCLGLLHVDRAVREAVCLKDVHGNLHPATNSGTRF